MSEFPFLSVIVFTPIVTFVLILLLPKERGENARMFGLAAMLLSLVLSAWVYYGYYQVLPDLQPGGSWAETLRFTEQYVWVESIGLSYFAGVDGLSATLVLLTSIVGVGGVLVSWSISDRPREFYAFFMLLVAGVQGVFVAVDGFMLFFFYELAVLPMYVLIVIWGWKERREYAAMKLTLYLLIGSFVSFIAFLYLYFQLPEPTFDLTVWDAYGFDRDLQIVIFVPFFIGFAVLGGLWPFHNWSPDGHVAAPTAVSMIHAGVLMKLGAYASMRMSIQMLPDGTIYWMPFIIILTVINVIYGSLVAMRQKDMKYMIGYSSVSHMGLVAMGFAAMNLNGFTGAGIQMVSHGIMTALFFAIVGMMYDRTHTRDMDNMSGMMKMFPVAMVAFILASLVSMGMPGLSGFIAEFPIFLGVWEAGGYDFANIPSAFGLNPASFYPLLAIISILGIIITAAYLLRVITSVFFGDYDEHKWHDMRPSLPIDKVTMVSFCLILVFIGIFPAIIEPIVRAGMAPVVDQLDTARETAALLNDNSQGVVQILSRLFGG